MYLFIFFFFFARIFWFDKLFFVSSRAFLSMCWRFHLQTVSNNKFDHVFHFDISIVFVDPGRVYTILFHPPIILFSFFNFKMITIIYRRPSLKSNLHQSIDCSGWHSCACFFVSATTFCFCLENIFFTLKTVRDYLQFDIRLRCLFFER